MVDPGCIDLSVHDDYFGRDVLGRAVVAVHGGIYRGGDCGGGICGYVGIMGMRGIDGTES